MKLVEFSEQSSEVRQIVHWETQARETGLDLTVAAVEKIVRGGALDFGGSEEEAARCSKVPAKKEDEEDDYGWWRLPEGRYVIRFNETVKPKEGQIGLILPLPRLKRAGADHAAALVEGNGDDPSVLLSVSEAGVRLKENCRLSRLLLVARE